jgi:hypothetical protein
VPSGFDHLDLINSLAKLKAEDDDEGEEGEEEKKPSAQKDFEDVINLGLFNQNPGKPQASARKGQQVSDKVEVKDWQAILK